MEGVFIYFNLILTSGRGAKLKLTIPAPTPTLLGGNIQPPPKPREMPLERG